MKLWPTFFSIFSLELVIYDQDEFEKLSLLTNWIFFLVDYIFFKQIT